MDPSALSRLGRTALPIVALLVFATVIGLTIRAAIGADTLGYDFLAYHQAAVRLLNGEPLYDMSYATTGGFGLFYYPPTFAPLILPLGLLTATTAVYAWTAGLIASFAIGTSILPVSRTVRWWIVLLAGLSWPFAYAVKLGQVGPILYLLFAIGWRWLDDPIRVGVSAALGTAIKLQPAIIFVWAALTRRWVAVAVGVGVLAILSVLATLIAGVGAWSDFATLVRQVGDPITTPHNFTPGAIAYQLGAPPPRSHRSSSWHRPWWSSAPSSPLHGGRRPRRRTWSRSSPASCCHPSCGTTTRCCCCSRSPTCAQPAAGGRWRSRS